MDDGRQFDESISEGHDGVVSQPLLVPVLEVVQRNGSDQIHSPTVELGD